MKFFYMSSVPNSEFQYVVHERCCPEIPSPYDRDYLGPYNSAIEAIRAVAEAKDNVSTCPKCWNKTEIYVVR